MFCSPDRVGPLRTGPARSAADRGDSTVGQVPHVIEFLACKQPVDYQMIMDYCDVISAVLYQKLAAARVSLRCGLV